jgi:hypothetical protein
MIDILENPRRRHVLQYLKQQDGSVPVHELALHNAAWEGGKPTEQVTATEHRDVYISLHELHLPKLYTSRVVNYDRSQGTVERMDQT